MDLRAELENLGLALKTVVSRLSRGVYKHGSRPFEPPITDARGRLVRSVGMTQTFLNTAQVDELVTLYERGMAPREIAERFGIYHRTVIGHLVRRSVPMRRRGLAEEHVTEAVQLYESGLTLMEVGLRFGTSQQAVRRSIAAQGVEIRPRGPRSRFGS